MRLEAFIIGNPGNQFSGPELLIAAQQLDSFLSEHDKKVAINMAYFFDQTSFVQHPKDKRKKIADFNPEDFASLRSIFHDTPGMCHLTSAFICTRTQLDYVLGFVNQNVPQTDTVLTILHSFNKDTETDFFIDFQFESTLASGHPDFVEVDWDSVERYEGVVIPKNIITSIFRYYQDQQKTPTVLIFLQSYIFSDDDKTQAFIEIVNNGGKKWDINNFLIKDK